MRLTGLLFLSAFYTSAVLAAPACDGVVDDFLEKSQAISQELKAKGYHSFDGISVSVFEETASSTNIEATGWFERAEPTIPTLLHTARSTAQWSCHARACKIQVNCDLWNKSSPDARKVIGMHERSGPARVNDHNYQNTTRMWLLSLPETDHILNPSEKAKIRDGIRLAGGITAVGGGGDTVGVSAKVALLKMDLLKMKGLPESAARQKAFDNLQADFEIKNEIRRGPEGHELESFSESPSSRADDLNRFNICNDFLHYPLAEKQVIYRGLVARDTKMQKLFPEFSNLVSYCRQATGESP